MKWIVSIIKIDLIWFVVGRVFWKRVTKFENVSKGHFGFPAWELLDQGLKTDNKMRKTTCYKWLVIIIDLSCYKTTFAYRIFECFWNAYQILPLHCLDLQRLIQRSLWNQLHRQREHRASHRYLYQNYILWSCYLLQSSSEF